MEEVVVEAVEAAVQRDILETCMASSSSYWRPPPLLV
jgi:hypothetical protein